MSGAPAGGDEAGGSERVAYDRQRVPPASLPRRIRRFVFHAGLRALTLVQSWSVRVASALGPRPRPLPEDGADILLTGTFYADNWVAAHIAPLAASRRCRRLRVVTNYQGPAIDKVEWVAPSRWLRPLGGATGARLGTFVAEALRTRPHVMGGFHLLLNGLVALPVARLVGARAIYFCGGGPTEVLDGGVWGQNRLFTLMETPDAVVERRLLRAVAGFDLVITMGRRAIGFFRARGVDTTFHVVSGGMDAQRFAPSSTPPRADFILVARLSAVKRVDLFLQALQRVARARPQASAIVVGDGPLLDDLKRQARELGLADRVIFAGHQSDVEGWLKQARVFVLTSDSEGLSLALMEAMLCGLPAVVSDVGDLPELVEEGVNGFLVAERSPDAFAERMLLLVRSEESLGRFSATARRSAERYGLDHTTRRWDEILAGSGG
ncbi:MAG TPA: glycosyltransferase [Vicinamibacteria bacterium]|nr:glycosyltransferase [Vicinamibacteria bacterium]